MIPALTEAEEEKLARQAVRRLGGSWCSLSQRRASKVHKGLCDARIRAYGVAWWYECKRDGGQLTREQLDFLSGEYQCEQIVFCGTAADLTPFLQMLASFRFDPTCSRDDLRNREAHLARCRMYGWATVQRVAARGFRRST